MFVQITIIILNDRDTAIQRNIQRERELPEDLKFNLGFDAVVLKNISRENSQAKKETIDEDNNADDDDCYLEKCFKP